MIQLVLPSLERFKMTKISMNLFHNVLWKVADITRGMLPPLKFLPYIEALLLLKANSDFHFDETQNYKLSESARWSVIKSTPYNCIGDALNLALRETIDKNPDLWDAFRDLDFNSESIGDKFRRNEVLMNIVQILSSISFKDVDFEINVAQILDSELKSKGHAFTPNEIAKLMVRILSPESEMTIYDPFCNDGGSLIESARFIKENYGHVDTSNLNGQVQNMDTYRTCMVNLILNGFVGVHIARGNTIHSPKFICDRGEREGSIAIFDRVIGIIPMGVRDWGAEVAETDRYNRFVYGIPPRTRGEYGFLQHMVASTNRSGKLASIVRKEATFRTGKSESRIRELMLRRDDIVEAVIDLPPKMFPQTTIQCSILVINKNKPVARKNKVLFVDCSNDFEKGRMLNTLREKDIGKVIESYEKYEDVNGYCSVVSMEEIAANEFSLEVSRYISKPSPHEETLTIDLEKALKELKDIRKQKEVVADRIGKFIEELNALEDIK